MGKTKHPGPMKKTLRPDPKLWVSPIPFGLGKIKPKHIRDSLMKVWENKDNLSYAARIITKGVCDGCALGVAGLQDQTLKGPHMCTTRLNVLRLNTMPAMKEEIIHADIDKLRKLDSTELRKLGRIPYPLIRRKGETKFSRITWDAAMELIAAKMKKLDPRQYAFYLTSRGITNESYYVAGKVARFLGTNNIDNASRICHSPSKTALKRSIGVGASTVNYQDWIGTDVLLFWGSVASNSSPVSTKYMLEAKKKGTKIIVINPYREPSMEKYWVPSNVESALFGTRIADDFYQVNIGGDIAFMHGIMKHWFHMEENKHGSAINHDFVSQHVNGYALLKDKVLEQSWEEIVRSSGVSKERIIELAVLLAKSKNAVFAWALGLTMHSFATDNISQVANLALLRGYLGRAHAGLMPFRGHSSVQGSGEMGADPFVLPGGEFDEENIERIEELWGFELPKWQGDSLGVTLENILLPEDHERKIKLYYMSGGNFLETMPDPNFIEKALTELDIRVHQDIIFNTSTLLDEGITAKELSQVLEIEEADIKEVINEMKKDYEDSRRGIQLTVLAGKYQFTTKSEHAEYYRKLIHNPGHSGLSQAALETLAIIAYRQPITRVEVEEIRGVKAEKAIQSLVTKLLVTEVGRKEGSGRAILYGTTKEFLDYFGLSSLKELPPLPENVEDLGDEDADLFYKRFEESMDDLFSPDESKEPVRS